VSVAIKRTVPREDWSDGCLIAESSSTRNVYTAGDGRQYIRRHGGGQTSLVDGVHVVKSRSLNATDAEMKDLTESIRAVNGITDNHERCQHTFTDTPSSNPAKEATR
jgi:hypothetical protein